MPNYKRAALAVALPLSRRDVAIMIASPPVAVALTPERLPQAAAAALVPVGLAIGVDGSIRVGIRAVTLSGPGRIDVVDGQTRYEVARSLVDHGDFVIRDKEAWFAVFPGRKGELHSNYRFPQSVLGVLFLWVADGTGPVSELRRQFFFTLMSPLAAALLALTYSLWFRGLGYNHSASLFWACAGIFCTPSWFYGTSTFDDILGTTTIVAAVAVMWLGRQRWPFLAAGVSGLLFAWAFNCKPPLVLFALPALAAGGAWSTVEPATFGTGDSDWRRYSPRHRRHDRLSGLQVSA